MTTAIVPPSVVEVVPAGEVEARIAAATRELVDLDAELAALLAEAEDLESRVGSTFDSVTYEFLSIRLQRFLDDLRAEANADMDTLLVAADGQGRRRRSVDLTWGHLVARPRPSASVVVAEASAATRDEPPAGATAGATAVPSGPEALPSGPEVPPSGPEVPPSGPEVPPSGPVSHPLGASDPETAVPGVVDVDLDLESAFWADADAERGRSHAMRTVRAVGLQAVAVLLVLAAVLFRIG